MKDITNFQRQAVAAIDSGNATELLALISEHPGLVKDRLPGAAEGYFKDPYLLWFVADNPIRVEKLPPNILEITRLLVDATKQAAPETYQYQLDYTLVLVASGRVVRECGVQMEMIDFARCHLNGWNVAFRSLMAIAILALAEKALKQE